MPLNWIFFNIQQNSFLSIVNIEIFAQYIFSCRVLDAQRFDMSENYNHNRTTRIYCYVRKNVITRIYPQDLMRENLAVRNYLHLQYWIPLSSLAGNECKTVSYFETRKTSEYFCCNQ